MSMAASETVRSIRFSPLSFDFADSINSRIARRVDRFQGDHHRCSAQWHSVIATSSGPAFVYRKQIL
jgi:hypothetical protein